MNISFFSRLLALLLLFAGCLVLWSLGQYQNPASLLRYSHLKSTAESWSFRRTLIRNSMARKHVFIPASSPLFHFVGRWVPTANRRRKDASFAGAHVDFAMCNSSSIYLELHNKPLKSHAMETTSTDSAHRSVALSLTNNPRSPASAVSLLALVDNREAFQFVDNGHGTLQISTKLNRTRSYNVKVLFTGGVGGDGTLEFEGIWLDKGGYLKPLSDSTAQTRKVIEILTPLSVANATSGLQDWVCQLSDHFTVDHALVPISEHCLTPACAASSAIHELYFRSGPPSTRHFQRPWSFNTIIPSVLVLDIGLSDYMSFFSNSDPPPSQQAITRFSARFVTSYITLIHNIRTTAYPYSSSHHDQLSPYTSTLNFGASFNYNSAPSTLPIFLLTPPTATMSRRLHRLLSHAIQTVVSTLQSQGDKATFWIDTSGWLDPESDIATTSITNHDVDSDKNKSTPPFPPDLTASGHAKVASFLSLHLCPYLSETCEDEIDAPECCPFNKPDNYLGHLYEPETADLDKIMEANKVRRVLDVLGL